MGLKAFFFPKTTEALRYAQHLARALHQAHFPENTRWRVSDDLLTVLSQIDNMTTALVRKR